MRKVVLVLCLISMLLFSFSSVQAWWNNDWKKCRDVTFYQENTLERRNESVKVMISDDDITDCDQLRFVNAPCNGGGNETPSQILDDSDEANGNCFMLVLIDRPTASDVTYSVYYGNPSASPLSYPDQIKVTEDSTHWHIDANNYKKLSFRNVSGSFGYFEDKNGNKVGGYSFVHGNTGSYPSDETTWFNYDIVQVDPYTKSGDKCNITDGNLSVKINCISSELPNIKVEYWFYPNYFDYYFNLTDANNNFDWDIANKLVDIGNPPYYRNTSMGYVVIDLPWSSNFVRVWDPKPIISGGNYLLLELSYNPWDGKNYYEVLHGYCYDDGACMNTDYYNGRITLDYGTPNNQLGIDEVTKFLNPLKYVIGEEIGDQDNDGTKDSEDACPTTFGVYCNGCPEPTCHGCAVSYCPETGIPYCIVDNSKCSPTTCPLNGCNVGTCYKNQIGTYTPSENTCELVDDTGTCTNNPCVLTCTFDKVCEMQDEISILKEQLRQTQEEVSILKTTINTIQGQILALESIINNLKYYVNLIICQLLPKGLMKEVKCPVY